MSRSDENVSYSVVDVASVPHRSAFRYPGGKTWLVPEVRRWLGSFPKRPAIFCEPFCGGGIAGLTALFEGLAGSIVLVELDEDVASVWQTMLNGQINDLVAKISEFEVSEESVRAILDRPPDTVLERAFATILRNRVQRGGILAPGASLMKEGENGRGLLSRWYPATLRRRMRDINARGDQIQFVHGDGIDWMNENAHRRDCVFFIDPPYTLAGRRLYKHSEIDHQQLFEVTSKVSGDFLMTYDDVEPIRELAGKLGFDRHVALMKNTHHRIMRELLIGRDLSWARSSSTEPIQYPLLEPSEAHRVTCDQCFY